MRALNTHPPCPTRHPAPNDYHGILSHPGSAGVLLLPADVAATLPGRPTGLSPEQREALAALTPRLHELCAELDGYGLPPAIEHGDFWAGQIIAGPQGFTFLDWSDSSISHPFFSLLLFLIEIEDHFLKMFW